LQDLQSFSQARVPNREGVIENITTCFELQKEEKRKVIRVLENVREYANMGITYKGQISKGQGRKPLVTQPQEYHIMIDWMEKGLGISTAMHQINEYCTEEDLQEIGLRTIVG
jgi:hypothetical protein